MKLNNKGWGYRVFVFYLCIFCVCLLVAHHYIDIVINFMGLR